MAYVTTKAALPPARARLVEVMQGLNFGRLEGIAVRKGEPVFDPPPRVIREFKFGRKDGPRPEAAKPNFTLKTEVLDLFAQLEAMGDGVIQCLEVQRGLPFRMSAQEDAA